MNETPNASEDDAVPTAFPPRYEDFWAPPAAAQRLEEVRKAQRDTDASLWRRNLRIAALIVWRFFVA